MTSDLMGECNHLKGPIADFTETFCSRCLQKDCTRSQFGKSKFDSRVATWEQRLFLDVPRLDPSEAKARQLNAINFTSPPVSRDSNNQPSWNDPRDIAPTKAYSIPMQVEQNPVITEVVLDMPKEPEAKVNIVQEEVPAINPTNTPNKFGQMLVGAPKNPPLPVYDPWKTKTPPKPGEVVVRPGAKIKLG